MSSFRRRLMMAALEVLDRLSDWFRSEGWFRSDPW